MAALLTTAIPMMRPMFFPALATVSLFRAAPHLGEAGDHPAEQPELVP